MSQVLAQEAYEFVQWDSLRYHINVKKNNEKGSDIGRYINHL